MSPIRLYRDDVWETYFARLRRDDPVHFVADNEMYGLFWSVTKYKDIMQMGINHRLFSSEMGGITLLDDYRAGTNFIAMDPPWHDEQRKVVSPVVAPGNLANMAPVIHESRAASWTLSRATRFSIGLISYRSN